MPERIEGLVTAAHTPMHADGSLNLETIDRLADAQAAAGVRGVFVCGTAGEGQSLTVAERKAVAERWRKAAGERILVIPHVGANCLADAKELAAHAEAIGADAMAAMAPSFSAPTRADTLADFLAEIAAAAPRTPFYYYHLPSRTHVTVAAAALMRVAADRIPTFAGLKFTDYNLMDFGECVRRAGDRLTVLFGRTEHLLAGLAMGAHGSIGGPYNSCAPLFLRLYRAYRAGDLAAARCAQDKGRTFGIITKRFGGLAALKAVMKMIGLDCGPSRLPLRNLTDEEFAVLRDELRTIGFFDECIGAPA